MPSAVAARSAPPFFRYIMMRRAHGWMSVPCIASIDPTTSLFPLPILRHILGKLLSRGCSPRFCTFQSWLSPSCTILLTHGPHFYHISTRVSHFPPVLCSNSPPRPRVAPRPAPPPAGYTGAQLFTQGVCYTYDDVIFHPGHISFGAHEVDISSYVTRNIKLRVPIVSSPMDTVTEVGMAVAMAQCGGLGFLHYNSTIEEQADWVRRVKAHREGTVTSPAVLGPKAAVRDMDALKSAKGFCSVW